MKVFVAIVAALWMCLACPGSLFAEASGSGWLGVQIEEVSRADADALGWESPRGVKVLKLVPGAPGEIAGLVAGDLVLSADGTEIENVKAFVALVSSRAPNSRIKLRLLRNHKEKVLTAILGSRPNEQAGTETPPPQNSSATSDVSWNAISISSAPPSGVKGHIILISNSDYKFFAKLSGPSRDVHAAASAFAQIGFRTTVLADPTKEEILQAIKAAQAESDQQLIGLYYSGHAAAINNENTIVLTSFDPTSTNYAGSLLPIKTVLSLLGSANASKIFVAFDACRSLYSVRENVASLEKKRALIAPLFGSYRGVKMPKADLKLLNRKEYSVLFSTSEKEVALDSTDNGISPFTVSFVTALGRETSFIQAMLLAKRLTEEKTNGAQSPDIDIKWNGDLQYAAAHTITNEALFELNDPLKPAMFNAPKEALDTYTRHLSDEGLEYDALAIGDEKVGACKDSAEAENPNFYWSVSTLNIEQCLLKNAGLKDGSSLIFGFAPDTPVYLAANYSKAMWKLDLDFDGKPETLRARLTNAGMSLAFKSASKEVEFRGLVGPNIQFLGLYDFNKDGVLDVFLEVTFPSEGISETELIILDGKKLTNEKYHSLKCIEGTQWLANDLCTRQLALMKSMTKSLFAKDVDQAYYGGDILQYEIYGDWNIKDWRLDDLGNLSITTYSATWPYEHFLPENYMPGKKIAFNPGSGKLDITIDDEKTFKIPTVSDRLAGIN
jgi:Caspase domain/PDZ domain